MFRRSAAAVAVTALAFAGIAADGATGASVTIPDLKVTAAAGTITVSGTPEFGGGDAFVLTDDGVDGSPGFDIVSATLAQDGDMLVATMEISGAFSPLAQYMLPLGVTGLGDNQLVAYANTTADFEFQIANFDDGYVSTPITGSVSGSTITWDVPISSLGAREGARIFAGVEPLHTAVGVSNASVGSVNAGCCVEIDTADWIAPDFVIGGGAVISIVGKGVDEQITAKTRRGMFTGVLEDLAPGAYTVTVTSGYADATFEKVFKVTL